jgi:hypothetical protein
VHAKAGEAGVSTARPVQQVIALAAIAVLLWSEPNSAIAQDQIDLMLQRGHVPADMRNRHGYSDFTDPLGRFLDLLAAGAFVEARAIQSDACSAWLATRQSSALTGKFWIWDTEINLDTLCAHR